MSDDIIRHNDSVLNVTEHTLALEEYANRCIFNMEMLKDFKFNRTFKMHLEYAAERMGAEFALTFRGYYPTKRETLVKVAETWVDMLKADVRSSRPGLWAWLQRWFKISDPVFRTIEVCAVIDGMEIPRNQGYNIKYVTLEDNKLMNLRGDVRSWQDVKEGE